MPKLLIRWILAAVASCLWMAQPSWAADGNQGRLVSVEWLEKNLKSDDLVLLDASPPPLYAAKHIPGALNVDVFTSGAQDVPAAEMERRLQSWGVSAGKRIVVYDQGGTWFATRLFFDLHYHGFPTNRLFVLDGGLAKWQAAGAQVTKDATPAPKPGTFRITKINDDARVRLPEFLLASGDPARSALIEALEPSYHFGQTKFFDRAGHVPNGIMVPTGDFYNPDKTFKSPEEIARMMSYLGIKREQQVHSYCGGGGAAAVPFFALKFILDYPKVKLYKESQMEWLQDERGLPFWTYDAPFLKREASWLQGWSNKMMRMYGVTRLSVVDVRPAEAFREGHVPYALNVPAEVFRRHLGSPEKLAELLGPSGVDSAHEAVVVSQGGLNPSSALAFLMLEWVGQKKVSVLMDSVGEWALRGHPLSMEPTAVGPKKSPNDVSIPATVYPPRTRVGVLVGKHELGKGLYPTVLIASGKSVPVAAGDSKVIHVPYTELLNDDGTPKAAKEIWNILVKAGVPRYAEIVCFSDDPGEAAVNYFVMKLMGYPDVKVLVG